MTTDQIQQGFKKIFDDARKSPVYWVEGIILQHERRMAGLKDKLRRTHWYSGSKIQHLKGQISATRKSLAEAKNAMTEIEASDL